MKNYYEILGIKKSASDEEIRLRWVELMKQYHPDVRDGKVRDERTPGENVPNENVPNENVKDEKVKRSTRPTIP